MPTYTFYCNICELHFDDVKPINDHKWAECPKCTRDAHHDLTATLEGMQSEVRMINNALVTDFDGSGEKTYTRQEYKDKCKELGRDPVGLLWS